MLACKQRTAGSRQLNFVEMTDPVILTHIRLWHPATEFSIRVREKGNSKVRNSLALYPGHLEFLHWQSQGLKGGGNEHVSMFYMGTWKQ